MFKPSELKPYAGYIFGGLGLLTLTVAAFRFDPMAAPVGIGLILLGVHLFNKYGK